MTTQRDDRTANWTMATDEDWAAYIKNNVCATRGYEGENAYDAEIEMLLAASAF